MERSFLDDENSAKLKTFAQIMAVKGQMRRYTNDAWIMLQMALCNISEPAAPPNAKHNICFFGDTNWCYLVVRYLNHAEPADNGLSALRIDRKYLREQFAPGGIPNKSRMEVITRSLLAILNVDPAQVDLDKLSFLDNARN